MKKLIHINHLVYERPLLITKSGFQTIDRLLKRRAEEPEEDIDPEEMMGGEYDMEIEEGVAYIHINGPIGKNLGLLAKVCGACDIMTLKDEVQFAETHPDCEMICFVVDSPGGSVDSVPEVAEYIAEVGKRKPTCAYIEGMACSAAYYLCSGVSDGIYASGKTNYIGSVGVYTQLFDESRMYDNAGVKPVLIKAGERKGEGLPGMPIDEEMKAELQKEVDYIYGLFTSHVKTYRTINDEDLQGQAFYAEEALSKGFIDDIVLSKEELFTKRY